jgi:hypothetical protein
MPGIPVNRRRSITFAGTDLGDAIAFDHHDRIANDLPSSAHQLAEADDRCLRRCGPGRNKERDKRQNSQYRAIHSGYHTQPSS